MAAYQAPPCRYFFGHGWCKFGDQCRFSHDDSVGQRHFSNRPVVASPVLESQESDAIITVMSYNVLADAYALKHKHELYAQTPMGCLSWSNRAQLLAREIIHWSPTIVCLQEVDKYKDIEDKLRHHGYVGRFLQRTNDRPDGLAMFWKDDVFAVESMEDVMFSEHGLRDNVAQVYRLRMRKQDKDAHFDIVVSNVHVLFNPKRGDIKLGQVRILMELITRESHGGSIPVVMCGDYNSAPYSGVYDFMSNGHLDFLERDRRTVSGQIAGNRSEGTKSGSTKPPKPWKMDEIATALGNPLLACDTIPPTSAVLTHCLDLTSSYRHVLGDEPHLTTAHDKYVGTVDYIFFSKTLTTEGAVGWCIEPRAVLLPPPVNSILPQGLPRGWFGSDHVSLFVQFGCTYK
jgi:mRNA deadenylase 3'-5' endonuclease subunit Ccr4